VAGLARGYVWRWNAGRHTRRRQHQTPAHLQIGSFVTHKENHPNDSKKAGKKRVLQIYESKRK